MKKFLLTILPVALCLAACNDDTTDTNTPPQGGKGTIIITPGLNLDVETIHMRSTSTDLSTFSLILDGPEGTKTIAFPSDGRVEDIEIGDYTVTLTSHPDGFTTPAFDTQVYEATGNVTVELDQTSRLNLTCTQINAGIQFVYDPSLEVAGLLNVVPKVSNGTNSLSYSGDNRDLAGYFVPGNYTMTFEQEGTELTLLNPEDANIHIAAAKLLEVTLTYEGTRLGVSTRSLR